MPTLEELLAQLRVLDLPSDKYAVFGSGPMAIRGLREINDLDLVVTPDLWDELSTTHEPHDHDHGLKRIDVEDVEILDDWYPNVGNIAELIRHADVVEGVRFVSLEKVLEWKRVRGEKQDRRDVELIEDWLERWRGPQVMKAKPPASEPEGDKENRVFIGGQYDFMPSLRAIAQMVRDFSCKELPLVPIIAYDYGISPEDTLEDDVKLLTDCRYAVFDLSDLGAQLYELRVADTERDRIKKTLIVYPVRERRNKPERGERTVLSAGFPHMGYQTFDELRGLVWRFLTGTTNLKAPHPRLMHDPELDKRVRRGLLLISRRRYKKAYEILEEVSDTARFERAIEPKLNMAVAAFYRKEPTTVEDAFSEAESIAGSDLRDQAEILYYRGVLDRLSKPAKLAEAEAQLLKALELFEEVNDYPDARVLITLGWIERARGKRFSAMMRMKLALTDDPNISDPLVTVNALNNLSYYYTLEYEENGRSRWPYLQEALRLSQDLVDYHDAFGRGDGEWLDTRGWALSLAAKAAAEAGDQDEHAALIEEGLKALEKARAQYPDDPPDHIGRHWDEALEIEEHT